MYKWLILVVVSIASQPLAATDKEQFCEAYSKKIALQKVAYGNYCNINKDNKTLFPAFTELMEIRQKNNKEPTEIDYQYPELNWCYLVKNSHVIKQQKTLTQTINECKKEFQTLFGKTGKTLEDLVPKNYRMTADKSRPAIFHDFTHDGIDDVIFFVDSLTNKGATRLLVALSQKDGLLQTIPVAPYIVGTYEAESGQPSTTLNLIKPDRFSLVTQSLDNNHWDSRNEWVFRFSNSEFILIWSSSGHTRISYDESSDSIYESSVHNYTHGTAFTTKTERCDYYITDEAACYCDSAQPVHLHSTKITIANFTNEPDRY